MEDHSVEFGSDGRSDLFRVVAYPVYTDVDLRGYFIRFGQVVCDDVGVVVVTKKVSIDLEEACIGTEYVVD